MGNKQQNPELNKEVREKGLGRQYSEIKVGELTEAMAKRFNLGSYSKYIS